MRMSSRTDLNEAATNMVKLLTLITGLDDTQVDALMIEGSALHLKDKTLNILRHAIQVKERGEQV